MTDVREEVGGRNQSEQGPLGLRGKNQGIIRWYLSNAILNVHVIVITLRKCPLEEPLCQKEQPKAFIRNILGVYLRFLWDANFPLV